MNLLTNSIKVVNAVGIGKNTPSTEGQKIYKLAGLEKKKLKVNF